MPSQTPEICPVAGVSTAAGTVAAWDRRRRLDLAEWHLREAVLLEAAGQFEDAEGHLGDACEYLSIAAGRRIKVDTVDAARFELEKEKDK